MTVLVLWPIVLVSAFLYDFAITRYVVAVEARRGHAAGAWSALTYLVGLVGTLGIVKISPWLIVPECIGLYVGTLVGVRLHEKSEPAE